jgi:hypothetical protein
MIDLYRKLIGLNQILKKLRVWIISWNDSIIRNMRRQPLGGGGEGVEGDAIFG